MVEQPVGLGGDVPEGGMTDLKLRAALIRTLWLAVPDDAECTCSPGDQCYLCAAMEALGLGTWDGASDAEQKLHDAGKTIERAESAAAPVTFEVKRCASCPFALAGGWCTATEPDRDIDARNSPPDWCPLRVADRLVTLRVP